MKKAPPSEPSGAKRSARTDLGDNLVRRVAHSVCEALQTDHLVFELVSSFRQSSISLCARSKKFSGGGGFASEGGSGGV